MAGEDDLAKATVRIDPDLSYFRDKLRAGLESETGGEGVDVPIKPDLDQSKLQTGIAEVDAELQRLGQETIKPKVKPEVDTTEMAKAKIEEDRLGESIKTTNENLSKTKEAASSAGDGLSAMVAVAASLGPALLPIGATLLAGIGALLPVMLAAGTGLGAFAIAAIGTTGGVKGLEAELSKSVGAFRQLTAPDVLPVMNNMLGLVSPLFANLVPAVSSTARELTHLEDAARSAFQAPFWHGFVTMLDSQAGPALNSFMSLAGGVIKMVAGVAQAFSPLISGIENGLTRVGAAMASWGQGLSASGGFQSFMHYVEMEAPTVGNLISNLAQLIEHLVVALAPVGAVVLQIVTGLTDFLNAVTSINPALTTLGAAAGLLGLAYFKLSGPIKAATDALKGFQTVTAGSTLAKEASSAEQFGGKLAGLYGTVGGLTGLLTGLTAVVGVGLAAAFGYWAANQIYATQSNDALTASVNRLTHGVLDLPTRTIPQAQAALGSMEKQLDSLKSKLDLTSKSITDIGTVGSVGGHTTVENITATSGALVTLQLDIDHLKSKIAEGNTNLGILNDRFGVSRSSAESLAQSINLDLTKALSPTQLLQFGAALQQQAAQADMSAQALNRVATATHTTTTQMSSDVANAVNKTKQSWSSYGDAVTAFSSSTLPVSAQAITQFYSQQELQASSFTQNVQKAIQMGFDPRLISQIIQAGPAQASQLLQGLVSSQGQGLQQLTTQALNAMSQEGAQAVEQARLTQIAVSSKTEQVASDLPTALALSQAKSTTTAAQTIAQLASTFQGGLAGLEQVAQEYGITLPQSLIQQVEAVQGAATGQANAAKSGLGSQLPATSAEAQKLADTVPAALNSRQGAASSAGSGLAGAAGSGVTFGGPGLQGAFTAIVNAAINAANARAGDFVNLGASYGGGLASGITSTSGVVVNAVQGLVQQAYTAGQHGLVARSPSRLTAEGLGKPFAQGFAVGITENTPVVADAVQKMVTTAANAINPGQMAASAVSAELSYLFAGIGASTAAAANQAVYGRGSSPMQLGPPGLNSDQIAVEQRIQQDQASQAAFLSQLSSHAAATLPGNGPTIYSSPSISITVPTGTTAEMASAISSAVQTALEKHTSDLVAEINAT